MAYIFCFVVLTLAIMARCSTQVSDFKSSTTDVYGCHGSSVNMKWTYTGSDDLGVYMFYYEDTAAYMMHKKPGQEAVSHGQYVGRVAFVGNESKNEIGIRLYGVRPSDSGIYSLTLSKNGDKNADAKLTVLSGQTVQVKVSNDIVHADEPFDVHVTYTSSPIVTADISLMGEIHRQCASPCVFPNATLSTGDHWLQADVMYPNNSCTVSHRINLTVISGPAANTERIPGVVVSILVVAAVVVLVVVIIIYRRRKGKPSNNSDERPQPNTKQVQAYREVPNA